MPYCPQCRDEFQNWVKLCPDCGVELVEKLQPLPKPIKNTGYNEKLITVASFSHPEEAYIIRAKLESFGIPSFVADDYVITAIWLYSTAVGGVKIKVRESDVEEAQKLLKPVRHGIYEQVWTTEERCPRCNSPNNHYEMFHLRPFFLLWIFVEFPLPFFKRKWKCNDCGFEWK
jgi:hypothetical protein